VKPYLVTSLEAGRLPRWIPLLLCAVYVTAGLFGRDPWRPDDAAGFGIAHTMALGSAIDWLLPNVHGTLVPQGGPLPFWLGATAIRVGGVLSVIAGGALHGPLGDYLPAVVIAPDLAFRAVAAVGLAIALALLWYATYAFARRPEIQPDDPFGATASRKDFARAVADSALLALLASFGILARVHETTVDAAQVTWIALYLFGLAAALQRPRWGGVIVGLAIAATLLSRGIPLAVVLALTTLGLSLAVHPVPPGCRPIHACLAADCAAGVRRVACPAGPLQRCRRHAHQLDQRRRLDRRRRHCGSGRQHAPHLSTRLPVPWWPSTSTSGCSGTGTLLFGPTQASLDYYARTAVWFFWPLWPFVLWAIWRWRGSRLEAPVAVPAVMLVPLSVLALLDPVGSEASLLPLVLPMTMLAALALPTIRRSVVGLIDWFSVMTFSVVGFAIWAYWIAFMTGFPPRMAEKAQEAVPGFTAPLSVLELVLGALATGAWIALVLWRVSRQPRPFWRPMALSSGGMVLTWFLLMTLWLPAANFRKSYREVVSPVRDILASETGCVTGVGLDVAQRALLAYYGNARFIRLPRMDGVEPSGRPESCRWMLVSDRETTPHDLEQVARAASAGSATTAAAHGASTSGASATGASATGASPAAAAPAGSSPAASPTAASGGPPSATPSVGASAPAKARAGTSPHAATATSASSGWTLIWHGQRRVSRGERLFLYAREGAPMK
jgi:4-amino-4-deoxy-L-arabinose transferase-like glycosyltransferase